MLALVALLTGAFLVFSTQSLSVLRRRSSGAAARARRDARRAAARAGRRRRRARAGRLAARRCTGRAVRRRPAASCSRGDLGNGQLHAAGAPARRARWRCSRFLLIGTAVAGVGAWLPARAAARQAPAAALKGGDADTRRVAQPSWRCRPRAARARRAARVAAARRRTAVFGYAAIAALLFGAVLLVPALTVKILQHRAAHRTASVPDIALAQLRENVGALHIEPRGDHRELQPDGRDGDHGVFVPRFVRPLAGQAAAGRPAAARAARQRHAYWSGRDQAQARGGPGRRANRIPAHAPAAARRRAAAGHADRARLDTPQQVVADAAAGAQRCHAAAGSGRARLDLRGAAGSLRLRARSAASSCRSAAGRSRFTSPASGATTRAPPAPW